MYKCPKCNHTGDEGGNCPKCGTPMVENKDNGQGSGEQQGGSQ